MWVKTQELEDGYIHDTDEKITVEGLNKSSAKLHPAGTVLLAMYGATIGKLGILASPATCNQACCALIPKRSQFGPEYIFLSLLNRRKDIISLRMGAAQQNISQEVIKSFPLLCPKEDVMASFNHTVHPLLALIGVIQKKNTNLRNTRDFLLPKLISGEVLVESADEATAELVEQTA
jgi:type I restriction enzyme S subunit